MHYKIKTPFATIYLILVILISSHGLVDAKGLVFKSAIFRINNEAYLLEIAKTQSQRQLGLMFRPDLGLRNGMLFIYQNSARHRIWMKNTKIMLTVLWIDEVGQVLDIQHLKPCRQNPCESYGVNQPSKYIIELNHQAHNVNVGDKILGLDKF